MRPFVNVTEVALLVHRGVQLGRIDLIPDRTLQMTTTDFQTFRHMIEKQAPGNPERLFCFWIALFERLAIGGQEV